MEITFDPPKDITVVPEIKKTVDKITVIELKDQPERKTVIAVTVEAGIITLWKGDTYDAIGQWTDADVVARINEIYK
jgi:cyanophycinase-like exopeptidase